MTHDKPAASSSTTKIANFMVNDESSDDDLPLESNDSKEVTKEKSGPVLGCIFVQY